MSLEPSWVTAIPTTSSSRDSWLLTGLLTCIHFTDAHTPNWEKECEDLDLQLPKGIQVVGMAFAGAAAAAELVSNPLEFMKKALFGADLRIFGDLQSIYFGAEEPEKPKEAIKWSKLSGIRLDKSQWTLEDPVSVTWNESTVDERHMAIFRLKDNVTLQLGDTSKGAPAPLSSSKSKLVASARSPETHVGIPALGKVIGWMKDQQKCSDIRTDLGMERTSGRKAAKRKAETRRPFAIDVTLYRRVTNNQSSKDAVSLEILRETEGGAEVELLIDVVVYSPWDTPLAVVAEDLKASYVRQLEFLAQQAAEARTPPPAPLHFSVSQGQHLATIFSPSSEPKAEQLARRGQLQRRYRVPKDQPAFQRANAFEFVVDSTARLRNPHLSVGPSGVADGEKHLVKGDYLYFHYGQDNADDKGWGCSYRSLQTLCSWFLLQNFTAKVVPSLTEIQEILVAVGDKDVDFVGSRKWIGSFELSLILDHLFNVQSKIVHMKSGSEFPSKVREIAHHFDTHGTPIMIGGGVLAYTLLGVDVCEVTDSVSWLILDPHYTGTEDLKTVIDKGWCAWKSSDLFRADAFYNLCMPQRPPLDGI